MSVIPVKTDFLLGLLNEVGRTRSLADHETDLIEEIVTGECADREFEWTEEYDRMLIAASKRKGIHRLALDLGVSPGAAYMRLHRIRKRKGVKVRRVK